MTERIHPSGNQGPIPLDRNPIAWERVMPHASPREEYPSAVLERLLKGDQLSYAEIGGKLGITYSSVYRWVRTGNIPPPTYGERALKRWRRWKEENRDPLHTPAINQKRAASLRAYYKNHPAAARAQNPAAQESQTAYRGHRRGKGVVADEDKVLVGKARAAGRLDLLPDYEADLLEARFGREESLRAIAARSGGIHPFLVSLYIQKILANLRI